MGSFLGLEGSRGVGGDWGRGGLEQSCLDIYKVQNVDIMYIVNLVYPV